MASCRGVKPKPYLSRAASGVSMASRKTSVLDETLSRGRFRGQNPDRNRPVSLSHKTAYHTAIYGSQKEDVSTQPGPGWNYDQVLGVCTGRRMAQPEADRRPLRLRAMPPGRLRWKRRNPHHAGRHNNRAGPCGRVRRLRGAVVGGTGGQRSSMTLTTSCNTTARSPVKSPKPPAKREAQPPLQSVSLLLDRSLRTNPNEPPK